MQTLNDFSQLSQLQRIILTYNGTLTELLENLVDEKLTVIKLQESVEKTQTEHADLNLAANQDIVRRQICLQGQNSGKNWLYAESTIALARLPAEFRDELLHSQTPIGKLWTKYRSETFKELLPPFTETAGELAIHFGIQSENSLLGRTYRVFSQQQPVMILTEKFPTHYFLQSLSN